MRWVSLVAVLLLACGAPERAGRRAASETANAPGAPPPCVAEESVTLDVPKVAQETRNWCWAATAQMIIRTFPGHDVTQCQQATDIFSASCCGGTPPDTCVRGAWPQFERYGFAQPVISNAALPWDTLRNEISCKRHPVAFSWAWVGGGAHMLTAVGYTLLDGEKMVVVNDPAPPTAGQSYTITYDAYVKKANKYRHLRDYSALRLR